MSRPDLPIQNEAPNWSAKMRAGVFQVSDVADAALAAANSKIGSLTYLNAAPGSRFDIWYEDGPNAWPVARPSAGTSVRFNLCGGPATDDGPTWMIDRDYRDYVGTT